MRDVIKVGDSGQPLFPRKPKKPEEGFFEWLGRIFKWLIPGSQEKIEAYVLPRLPAQEQEMHKLLRERYEHNIDQVMLLSETNLNQFKVEGGLIIQQIDPQFHATAEQQQEVKNLIPQVYRQAWGRLIDAKYGLAVQEEELKRLNNLHAHLANAFPEILKSQDRDKPLSILLSSYGKKPVDPMDSRLMKEHKKVLKRANERISLIAQTRLKTQAIGEKEKGVNLTEFIALKDSGEKLAVRKSEVDEEMTWWTAQTYNRKVTNANLQVDPSELLFLSGFLESLASHLNIILQGKLGVPLAAQGDVVSIHAFSSNQGNLRKYVQDHVKGSSVNDVLESLPNDASQRFVFAELITKNCDAHSGNILISSSGEPIPIDFGRTLSPETPIRGAYLGFPCLDRPINVQDQAFFQDLNVEETMRSLEKILRKQYQEQFDNKRVRPILIEKLELVKARLYMIKMGLKAGMNQRQLIALDLPPLSKQSEEEYDLYISMHQGIINNLKARNDKERVQSILSNAYEDARTYSKQSGFDHAWEIAYNPASKKLNIRRFEEVLAKEISQIMAMDPHQLYTARENKLYRAAGIEMSVF